METINKDKLKEVFLNVRKAYRLLFEYQTKVLNLAKYIGDYFSYSYIGGWPLFSDACPKPGKGYLDNWSWDWLNMYAYAFYFGSKQIKDEKVSFEIRIYSDTGFYDSPYSETDKIKIETFENVENSKTKLVLIASNLGWEPNELLKNFTSKKNEYTLADDENNVCAKSYDLEDFIDEENTNNKLKDFIEFCKKNKITIK